MNDVLWNGKAFVLTEDHRLLALDVELDLTLQHQKELVLVVVLMPREVAFENPNRTTASLTVVSV